MNCIQISVCETLRLVVMESWGLSVTRCLNELCSKEDIGSHPRTGESQTSRRPPRLPEVLSTSGSLRFKSGPCAYQRSWRKLHTWSWKSGTSCYMPREVKCSSHLPTRESSDLQYWSLSQCYTPSKVNSFNSRLGDISRLIVLKSRRLTVTRLQKWNVFPSA